MCLYLWLHKLADADADVCLQASDVERSVCDREREREQRGVEVSCSLFSLFSDTLL